jgi:hypothetical protein
LIKYEEHLKKTQSDWESRWENVKELITFASEMEAQNQAEEAADAVAGGDDLIEMRWAPSHSTNNVCRETYLTSAPPLCGNSYKLQCCPLKGITNPRREIKMCVYSFLSSALLIIRCFGRK